jgi:hypothetical protein
MLLARRRPEHCEKGNKVKKKQTHYLLDTKAEKGAQLAAYDLTDAAEGGHIQRAKGGGRGEVRPVNSLSCTQHIHTTLQPLVFFVFCFFHSLFNAVFFLLFFEFSILLVFSASSRSPLAVCMRFCSLCACFKSLFAPSEMRR